MSGTLHVESLEITGFRGISDTLRVPLDARLTLIEAPNGTGKTTICEAAEWLLTGDVERLGASSEVLECHFGRNPAEVRARLRLGGEHVHVSRSVLEPKIWRFEPVPIGGPLGVTAALARFAPEAANEGGGGGLQIRRQWLRGARFLSGASLARLIDPDGADLRRNIFADLAGVRHLLDAHKRIADVLEKLRTEIRTRESYARGYNDEIANTKSDLAALPDLNIEALEERVQGALQKLGETAFGAELPAAAARVRQRLGHEEFLLEERSRASMHVDAEWDSIEEINLRLASLVSSITSLREGSQRIAVADAWIKRCMRLAGARTKLRQAEDEWAKFAVSGELLADDVPPPDATARAHLDQLISDQRAIRDAFALLSDTEQALNDARVQAPSAADLAQLADLVERASAELRGAREQYDSTAGAVRALHAAATRLADSLPSDAHCPACGHDWLQRQALVRALLAQTEAPSATLAAQAQAVETAERKLEEARLTRSSAIALRSRADECYDAHRRALDSWSRYEARLRGAGIDPMTGDVVSALLECRRTWDAAEAKRALRIARDRFNAATDSWEPNAAPPDALVGEIGPSSSAGALEAASALLQARVNESTARLEIAERERAELHNRQSKFYGAWRSLIAANSETSSAPQPPSIELRDRVRAKLTAAHNELRQEKAALAEVEALLHARDRHRTRDSMQRKLDATLERRAAASRALNRLRERANLLSEAADRYDEQQRSWTLEELHSLIGVASTLYCRAQANDLVTAIRSNGAQDPVRWFAEIGDGIAPLDPHAHFSQGQRQDLALAFYLARARSLGGTFFLDEPANHLDDLNRVALLDIFRVLAVEKGTDVSLVVTTASRGMVRHLQEKMRDVRSPDGRPVLRVIQLSGNAKIGVSLTDTTFGI